VIEETMRQWIHIIEAVVFCVVLAACNGEKPKELLETAELEERQHNLVHAKQLYEDLVRLYPSSPQAETARKRLASLNQSQ
jgi:ferritin-like protein